MLSSGVLLQVYDTIGCMTGAHTELLKGVAHLLNLHSYRTSGCRSGFMRRDSRLCLGDRLQDLRLCDTGRQKAAASRNLQGYASVD